MSAMESNSRLRRAREARGIQDIDIETLLRKRAELVANGDGPLSARSSPGSGDSTKSDKSTASSPLSDDGRSSLPPAKFARPPPPSAAISFDAFLPPLQLAPAVTTTSSPPPPPSRGATTVPPPQTSPPAPLTLTANTSRPGTTIVPILPEPNLKAGRIDGGNARDGRDGRGTELPDFSRSPGDSTSYTSSSSSLSTTTASVSLNPLPAFLATATNTGQGSTFSTRLSPPPSSAPSMTVPRSLSVPSPTQPGSTLPSAPAGNPFTAEALPDMGVFTSTGSAIGTVATSSSQLGTTGPNDGGEGLHAGIALGTLAGAGTLFAVLFFFYRRHKRNQARLGDTYARREAGASSSGTRPSVFTTIQERFHNMTAPITTRIADMREKKSSEGGDDSQTRGVRGGLAAGAAAVPNAKTQSQLINDLFQAAFAAENGMGDRNSADSSKYLAEKGYGQEDGPQPGIRSSFQSWLRGSTTDPFQPSPPRASEESRYTAPSWTQSVRSSTTSSILTEGDSMTSGVNSGLFPPGFRPASLLPPVPAIPAVSRWSESTNALSDAVAPSHDSLYSMYNRNTQMTGISTDQWDLRSPVSPISDGHAGLQQPVPTLPRDALERTVAARLDAQGRLHGVS